MILVLLLQEALTLLQIVFIDKALVKKRLNIFNGSSSYNTVSCRVQKTAVGRVKGISDKANLFATLVFTNMLARTKERMLSHITGCPSWANASFWVVTPQRITVSITIRDVI